jgi:hypothetical protein
MSRKKAKKAVKKKVEAVEVRRVPTAFDDVFPVELAQKGFSSWPFPRLYFPDQRIQVLKMNSWILAPFQMLLLKFRRRSFLLLWILLLLNLSIPKRRYLPNFRETLN